jgi:hypothetical protein
MGKVIPFPKQPTQRERAQDLSNDISLDIINLLEGYNINTASDSFCYDMAWVVKFIEVMVDNQFGLENDLAKHLQQFNTKDLYETQK